jgi:N-acetylglucosaminyldiphosphoundecaprenol N-acetyl-beta-D-mannosaminyltransferase
MSATGESAGQARDTQEARIVGETAGESANGVAATSQPRPAELPVPGKELGDRYRAQKRDFLGLGLSCMPDDAFVDAVRQAVQTRSRLTVSFINPDYALKAHRTPGLPEKINRFDVVLPDGWGVVLGARWLGFPVADRQGNNDICPKVFALSAEHGLSNFLLGYREGTAEGAAATVTAAFPGLPIAGTLHGHWDVKRGHPGRYDEADIDSMIDAINASNADILHVSLPTPLQQTWVWQVSDRLNVPVIITGGAYLDQVAERLYWYPGWIVKMRLCWAYRLVREPRRLWKRYSLDLMAYGGMVLKEKLTRRFSRSR